MGYHGDTVIHCQWEYNRDNVVQPEMSSAGEPPYFDGEFPIVSHVQWAKSLSFLGLSFHFSVSYSALVSHAGETTERANKVLYPSRLGMDIPASWLPTLVMGFPTSGKKKRSNP